MVGIGKIFSERGAGGFVPIFSLSLLSFSFGLRPSPFFLPVLIARSGFVFKAGETGRYFLRARCSGNEPDFGVLPKSGAIEPTWSRTFFLVRDPVSSDVLGSTFLRLLNFLANVYASCFGRGVSLFEPSGGCILYFSGFEPVYHVLTYLSNVLLASLS